MSCGNDVVLIMMSTWLENTIDNINFRRVLFKLYA